MEPSISIPPSIREAPSGALEGDGAPGEGPSGNPEKGGPPQDIDTCSEASLMSADDPLTPEEKMAMAVSLKDAGNALFKEGKYSEALEKYKEGGKRVKHATESEAIAVSVQLSSNSCMCCLKLERWQEAIEAANSVLAKEPKNLKALYRRAVARSNVGDLSLAREDLVAVIAVDSANVEARKELQRVKEKLLAAKAEDKKAYSGLFNRASGLYDDREAERERRKKEEEAERERRKPQWEKDMKARKDKGEEEEDFDTWLKKKKEAEEKEREEKQKKQAKQDASSGGSKRRSTKESSRSSSSSSSSSSVMEVDEEDAAIINETKKMGYCYFRRNLTEEEKLLNAQNRPTRISGDDASPQSETNNAKGDEKGKASPSSEGKSISQWNSRGTTYEEKDVSPWARTRFAERLQEAAASCGVPESASTDALIAACLKATQALGKDGLKDEKAAQEIMKECFSTKVETSSVGEVSGDTHLAVVRGSRRVFFDMKCSINLKVKCSCAGPLAQQGKDTDKEQEILGGYESAGVLHLPEVSSADGSGMCWLEGSKLSLDKAPPAMFKSMVDEVIKKYKQSVAEKIQAFLDDCIALP